eukprot:234896-Amphidinium_carterae.1
MGFSDLGIWLVGELTGLGTARVTCLTVGGSVFCYPGLCGLVATWFGASRCGKPRTQHRVLVPTVCFTSLLDVLAQETEQESTPVSSFC